MRVSRPGREVPLGSRTGMGRDRSHGAGRARGRGPGSGCLAAWGHPGESGIGGTSVAPECTAADIGDRRVPPGWRRARTLHHSRGRLRSWRTPTFRATAVPYRPGGLTAVARRDGGETGRTSLTTVGAPAALRSRRQPAQRGRFPAAAPPHLARSGRVTQVARAPGLRPVGLTLTVTPT
ncbi:hypothetical protein GCM10010300_25350 [Streptomyces olivaceoviridis]|nr:hypothetical protein GCM10010300_25350 [Streptomyces olivaceoviridis]